MASENLSPPNMSPIHDAETDRLYERIEHCFSTTQLNFTIDMSTDDTTERKDQGLVNGYYSLGKFAFSYNLIFKYILLFIFLIFTYIL